LLHVMTPPRAQRIVIADDDAPMRELLRTILSFAPAVEIVGEADDGAGAVRLALGERADTVVLDVNMPGIDGGRAAELIRAYRPRVNVLFHTAHVDNRLRQRAERLAAPILLKGDPQQVLDAVTRLAYGIPDRLEPAAALAVTAVEHGTADGVVVVDRDLQLLFYDVGAADLLGDPPPLELLRPTLAEALARGEAAVTRVGTDCELRAVALQENGRTAGVAGYLSAA
jgi:CheY-like chemotaxis protein